MVIVNSSLAIIIATAMSASAFTQLTSAHALYINALRMACTAAHQCNSRTAESVSHSPIKTLSINKSIIMDCRTFKDRVVAYLLAWEPAKRGHL